MDVFEMAPVKPGKSQIMFTAETSALSILGSFKPRLHDALEFVDKRLARAAI